LTSSPDVVARAARRRGTAGPHATTVLPVALQGVLPASQVVNPTVLYVGTPVVLISTRNADGTSNLAPFSSLWLLNRAAVLGIGRLSQTFRNLVRERECVLNLPSVELVAAVDRLAQTTGRDPVPAWKQTKGFVHVADKFARAGVTPVAADLVAAPRVAECGFQIEVRVRDIAKIEKEDGVRAVVMEVVRTHVHETIVADDHPHHIDPDRWRPLIMSFLEFYGLGARLHPSQLATFF
jgi:flavin reductase (DIM6/NTAB) family NADH-FMN oxidoreductase RutF